MFFACVATIVLLGQSGQPGCCDLHMYIAVKTKLIPKVMKSVFFAYMTPLYFMRS